MTASKTTTKRAPKSKIAVTEVKAADLQPKATITRKRAPKPPKAKAGQAVDLELDATDIHGDDDQLPQDNKLSADQMPDPVPAMTKAPKADTEAKARPDSWKLSTTEKPTKKVWNVADSMPGASRKDVIAACIELGIAPGTSRTQYQAWFKAMRDSGKAVR